MSKYHHASKNGGKVHIRSTGSSDTQCGFWMKSSTNFAVRADVTCEKCLELAKTLPGYNAEEARCEA